jgi:hypothetical protein
MNLISIIFFLLAGICNACMDVLRYRYNTSIFRFWKNQEWINPSLSWVNKWKPTTKLGDLIMSTVLVWVTDFWHFVKMLMILFFTFGAILYQPIFNSFPNIWLNLIILYFTFTGTFELFFSKILIKK